MGDVFTTLDLVIFFAALAIVMAVGLIAGRKENTSEDYFLAGHSIPWWGVAGSIFGSNVSANHMVGMMGVGFSIGFAQSHFELGAILGLMVLCYGFLPAYRKLNVYTLSEYLGRRYDDRSRVTYAIIMVIIMAIVQMVPGLYIGARSVCVLLGGKAAIHVPGEAIEYVGDRLAEENGDAVEKHHAPDEFRVNFAYYATFVAALALVSAAYTIFGGLKAVVWTDMIQSVLLLAAGIVIALITFQRIGGWGAMMALDQGPDGADKMRLYLPTNHSELPWTGVFTGLMAMHCFYWATNQFIVQRALGARSDAEARLGIVAAGFLKLLIPFFAIGAGVAAFYLFKTEMPGVSVAPDTAFSELVKLVILPIGPGLVGLISAGLIGAILSSIDSMMNSAATIVTIDIYQKYVNPEADDRRLILVGRLSIVFFVIVATLMAIFVLDPNSTKNFFLQIANYQNYLTPGLLVAFFMGMFWRGGTPTAAFVAIVAGVVFSWALEAGYNKTQGMNSTVYSLVMASENEREKKFLETKIDDLPEEMRKMSVAEMRTSLDKQRAELTPINRVLGPSLNFFHRVVGVILLCIVVYVAISKLGQVDVEKAKLVWTDLGNHGVHDLRDLALTIAISIVVYAFLGVTMWQKVLNPTVAAWIAAIWTMSMYIRGVARRLRMHIAEAEGKPINSIAFVLGDDRFWAGVLCSLAVFMHFVFY